MDLIINVLYVWFFINVVRWVGSITYAFYIGVKFGGAHMEKIKFKTNITDNILWIAPAIYFLR